MAWQKTLQTRWTALAVREQRGLTVTALVLLLALVWGALVAPAMRTLKLAETQRITLGATLSQMQALQLRATQLQAKPVLLPQDALRSLQAVTVAQGKSANLQVVGEQATVSLKQASALDVAQWLGPQSALALIPLEVHLQRDAGSALPQWSGTLVFRLPPAAR